MVQRVTNPGASGSIWAAVVIDLFSSVSIDLSVFSAQFLEVAADGLSKHSVGTPNGFNSTANGCSEFVMYELRARCNSLWWF